VLQTEGGVRLLASTAPPTVVPTPPKTREVEEHKPIFQLHIVHVADEVRRIRKGDAEKISLTKDYEPFPKGVGGGYKTTIYHGVEASTKKTIVITNAEGTKVVRTEKL
jgi:hypothetical protein